MKPLSTTQLPTSNRNYQETWENLVPKKNDKPNNVLKKKPNITPMITITMMMTTDRNDQPEHERNTSLPGPDRTTRPTGRASTSTLHYKP